MDVEDDLVLGSIDSHYFSPYLTCGECNAVAFVDVGKVEKALRLAASVTRLEESGLDDLEVLPVCSGCGMTSGWVVGVRDLREHIAKNAAQRRKELRIMKRCAIKLQAIVRGMRARKFVGQKLAEQREKFALEARCATLISSSYRGYLGRRRAMVEKCLRRIRNAHPRILRNGLHARGNRVFWYRRKPELDLLYRNYRLLVSRTGHEPPLHQVEANIIEIERRVVAGEDEEATIIQARVRGVLGRRFIREYRAEMARLMYLRTSAAFFIQFVYRRFQKVKRALEERNLAANRKAEQEYLLEIRARFLADHKARAKRRVIEAYRKDVRQDRVGKLLSSSRRNQSLKSRNRRITFEARDLLRIDEEGLRS